MESLGRYSISARTPLDFSVDSGGGRSSGHTLRRMIGSRKHTTVIPVRDVDPPGAADAVQPSEIQVVQEVIPSACSGAAFPSHDFFGLYLAAARSGFM